jgi:hypothetical protein
MVQSPGEKQTTYSVVVVVGAFGDWRMLFVVCTSVPLASIPTLLEPSHTHTHTRSCQIPGRGGGVDHDGGPGGWYAACPASRARRSKHPGAQRAVAK